MEDILNTLQWNDKGLIPVIVQEEQTNRVLMMAYMNEEAFRRTVETGEAHYWSRSRQQLWHKGETSGNIQHVRSIHLDCDGDTLLLQVEQTGSACHTGEKTCFYRKLEKNGFTVTGQTDDDTDKSSILREVYRVVSDRVVHPKEGSYTNYLLDKGIDKILKKVGEEAAEVIIASKNGSAEEIRYEVADLLYHLIVLLVERGLSLDEIYDELRGRR